MKESKTNLNTKNSSNSNGNIHGDKVHKLTKSHANNNESNKKNDNNNLMNPIIT